MLFCVACREGTTHAGLSCGESEYLCLYPLAVDISYDSHGYVMVYWLQILRGDIDGAYNGNTAILCLNR